jgi:hypothetical protein
MCTCPCKPFTFAGCLMEAMSSVVLHESRLSLEPGPLPASLCLARVWDSYTFRVGPDQDVLPQLTCSGVPPSQAPAMWGREGKLRVHTNVEVCREVTSISYYVKEGCPLRTLLSASLMITSSSLLRHMLPGLLAWVCRGLSVMPCRVWVQLVPIAFFQSVFQPHVDFSHCEYLITLKC